MSMKLRSIASIGVGLALVVGLAACGDDTVEEGTPEADGTLPPVSDGYAHPTGADEIVIEYAQVGGFVPREFAFQQTPNLLISGGGEAFSPGAQIAIYPGPLLPAVQVQSITEEGIQAILAAADDAGMLADVEYEAPTNIADASTTRLTISVNGETYVHEAYALGLALPDGSGEETTPERQALADFVAQLSDLPTLAGADNLGETALAEPEFYAIEAVVVDDLSAYGSDGIEPTVVEWPADVTVRLADATTCTEVPAAEVGPTLADANQLTFFSDADVTYQVLARPVLPSSSC